VGALPHIVAKIASASSTKRYQWAVSTLRSWKCLWLLLVPHRTFEWECSSALSKTTSRQTYSLSKLPTEHASAGHTHHDISRARAIVPVPLVLCHRARRIVPAPLCPCNRSRACDCATVSVPSCKCNRSCACAIVPVQLFLCPSHCACATMPVPPCLCHRACARAIVPVPLCPCNSARAIVPAKPLC